MGRTLPAVTHTEPLGNYFKQGGHPFGLNHLESLDASMATLLKLTAQLLPILSTGLPLCLFLSSAVAANGTFHPACASLVWHLFPPPLPVEVKEQERVMFAAMAL